MVSRVGQEACQFDLCGLMVNGVKKAEELEGDENEASDELARHAIPRVLTHLGVRVEEAFNYDETGIIFGAHSERTLAPTSIKGTKRDMDKLTLLLCCNVTGTEELKSLFCGQMHGRRGGREGTDRPELQMPTYTGRKRLRHG